MMVFLTARSVTIFLVFLFSDLIELGGRVEEWHST